MPSDPPKAFEATDFRPSRGGSSSIRAVLMKAKASDSLVAVVSSPRRRTSWPTVYHVGEPAVGACPCAKDRPRTPVVEQSLLCIFRN
jgi:hypothetical protein